VVQPPDGGDTIRRCFGASMCDGTVLRACNGGAWGAPIDDCAAERGCSLSRCTSPACAAIERDQTTFMGCLFYTAEADNVTSDASLATSFLITNPGPETATVALQPNADGTWFSTAQTTIPAGGAGRLSVAGLQVVKSGPQLGGALRVTSNRPVTVAQIQSDDGNENAHSSGGTMLLPVHVLGTRYLIMTYPQVETPAITATPGGAGGAGRVLVVGAHAGTEVTFTASKSAWVVVAGLLPSLAPGATLQTFVLNDGDVFQAWTGNEMDDLSGSEITATLPVAVFSGNITTTYGRVGQDIQSPDLAHEQMPPVADWSLRWVAASLPPQAETCDTLLGRAGASLWRLLAVSDHTRVDFVGPDGGEPLPETVTLDAGRVFDFVHNGDFLVEATEPLLVTQGIDCEPTLSLAISADEMLDDLTFAVLPYFDHVIAIAREGTDPITLDGELVKDELFSPAGGGFQVARVLLSTSTCPASKAACPHRLQGHFGVTLSGMDVVASYALTPPVWSTCLDPINLNCPQ
jgi:IgGFc binding protein